jgi:hypothetical protein
MTKPETEKLLNELGYALQRLLTPAQWEAEAITDRLNAIRAQGGGEPLAYLHPIDLSGVEDCDDTAGYVCRLFKRRGEIGVPIYTTPAPAPEVCTCPSGDGSLRWPCPEHPAPAPDAVADVREMKAGADSAFYVCVQVGDRYLTPNRYRERWKADFDAAEWNALFTGGKRPDILAFMPDGAHARSAGGEGDARVEQIFDPNC